MPRPRVASSVTDGSHNRLVENYFPLLYFSVKKQYLAGLVILFALSIILSADLLYAKPLPPPQLKAIFEKFTDLDDTFKAGHWDKALKSADNIAASFNTILPQLTVSIKGDISTAFNSMVINLKQSLRKKDEEGSEEQYIVMQEFFFALMAHYDYKAPPIMSIIDKFIFEAAEALKKKDFNKVVSEMDEVSSFFYREETLLAEHGANTRDIDEFKAAARETRSAGKTRKAKAAYSGIKKLEKLSAKFLQLF